VGPILVISGPSGVGKSTICRLLAERDPRVAISVSATTRAQRPGEEDGVHYRFLDVARFDELAAEGAFLEDALVHGRRYGTLRADVERVRAAGKVAVLEIDVQGARSIREAIPDAHLVFVLPPDHQTLRERLAGRATEREAEMELRMANALTELAAADLFDDRIVNADLDETVTVLRGIIDHLTAAA
jgi:guanylate kinase